MSHLLSRLQCNRDMYLSHLHCIRDKTEQMTHSYHLLLPRRVSHTFAPSNAIISYLREADVGDIVPSKNFVFDNSLITIFMERWRPETHTFPPTWRECTITL
ncbi:hypothetical protein AHAS_Ahas07G0118800 [Arachis hypogaea]